MPVSNRDKPLKQNWKDRLMYGVRHYCPKCKTVHRWKADRCHRVGCGYVGEFIKCEKGE